MIVIDASILANAIADDGKDGDRARAELRAAAVLAAPDLIDVQNGRRVPQALARGRAL